MRRWLSLAALVAVLLALAGFAEYKMRTAPRRVYDTSSGVILSAIPGHLISAGQGKPVIIHGTGVISEVSPGHYRISEYAPGQQHTRSGKLVPPSVIDGGGGGEPTESCALDADNWWFTGAYGRGIGGWSSVGDCWNVWGPITAGYYNVYYHCQPILWGCTWSDELEHGSSCRYTITQDYVYTYCPANGADDYYGAFITNQQYRLQMYSNITWSDGNTTGWEETDGVCLYCCP